MALVSSSLTKKRLKPTKNYKTLELIALEIKTDARDMVIIGIYRPPRNLCGDYKLLLENELSQECKSLLAEASFPCIQQAGEKRPLPRVEMVFD